MEGLCVLWRFCFLGNNSFASPVLLQVLAGICFPVPHGGLPPAEYGGRGFERAMSLAGRKVLFLLSLAS